MGTWGSGDVSRNRVALCLFLLALIPRLLYLASIPEEAMDLEALAASVAVRTAETPEVQKQEAVEAVQEAVEAFRKKFE